jgi:hypothetical protein
MLQAMHVGNNCRHPAAHTLLAQGKSAECKVWCVTLLTHSPCTAHSATCDGPLAAVCTHIRHRHASCRPQPAPSPLHPRRCTVHPPTSWVPNHSTLSPAPPLQVNCPPAPGPPFSAPPGEQAVTNSVGYGSQLLWPTTSQVTSQSTPVRQTALQPAAHSCCPLLKKTCAASLSKHLCLVG